MRAFANLIAECIKNIRFPNGINEFGYHCNRNIFIKLSSMLNVDPINTLIPNEKKNMLDSVWVYLQFTNHTAHCLHNLILLLGIYCTIF